MGLSSNQARFLSLTSRQVDLENRIQQICQRRLRLSSELENVATSYNNNISNRKMFTPSSSGINTLSLSNLNKLGYKLINSITKTAANSPIKAINQMTEAEAIQAGYTPIHNAQEFKTLINSNSAGKYMLVGDMDFSELGVQSTAIVQGSFSGIFDGNGYTMKNLSIATTGSNYVALFDGNGGTIKNAALENATITNTNGNYTAALVGINGGLIDNSYTTGTVSAGTGSWSAGITGSNEASGRITNSWSDVNVSGKEGVGGISGASANGNGFISSCYALGDVSGTTFVGGIVGVNRDGNAIVQNCYATGNVTGVNYVGGIAGGNYDMAHSSALPNQIVNSYYAGGTITGSSDVGGIVGYTASGYTSSGCFYTDTNLSGTDSSGATKGVNTTGWSTSVWDTSTALPSLISDGLVSANIEEGLRNGKYSLAKRSDEYTQDPLLINGSYYQEADWRSTPAIYDELYKGDDVAAENKYDKTIDEINSQDKKLQLEQTTIEVEYKAISSEKEAVKKILDTNASASFKYFS